MEAGVKGAILDMAMSTFVALCNQTWHGYFYYAYPQIKAENADVLIEVTSSKDLAICKQVLDTLLQKMLEGGISSAVEEEASVAESKQAELVLEQVRVTHNEGQLKVVYPSHVDLVTDAMKVIHLE